MAGHDRQIADAKRAGGLYIAEVARPQELGPNDADQRNPREEQEDAEQHEETRDEHGRDDEEQIQRWDCRPDFDEALEEQVHTAAEIALHGAGYHADDRR